MEEDASRNSQQTPIPLLTWFRTSVSGLRHGGGTHIGRLGRLGRSGIIPSVRIIKMR